MECEFECFECELHHDASVSLWSVKLVEIFFILSMLNAPLVLHMEDYQLSKHSASGFNIPLKLDCRRSSA